MDLPQDAQGSPTQGTTDLVHSHPMSLRARVKLEPLRSNCATDRLGCRTESINFHRRFRRHALGLQQPPPGANNPNTA